MLRQINLSLDGHARIPSRNRGDVPHMIDASPAIVPARNMPSSPTATIAGSFDWYVVKCVTSRVDPSE